MWLWIVATFVAFFIKGLCGFANTLVFTSIMAYGANNVNISPIELLLGYPANIILTWQNRKHLKVGVFLPLILLVLVGSIPGAFILKYVNARYIKIVFGVAIVFIGMELLYREWKQLQQKESKIILGLIGILSGVLCGMFGVGALLAAYLGRVTKTTDEFKANISIVFFIENTFRLFTYGFLGIITLAGLKQALLLIPVVLLGLFAGIGCSKLLDEKLAKRLVLVLLIISGFAMVVKNI